MNVFRYIQFIKIEKQTQIPMISILYAKNCFQHPFLTYTSIFHFLFAKFLTYILHVVTI